jgi:transposase
MGRRWIWTSEREQAVEGLALGYLSQRQVAEIIGVTRRTLEGWMRRSVFRERVAQARVAYVERVRAERAARFAARMAEEDAREQAEEEAFTQRLAAMAGLHGTQRVRALRALLR